MPSSINTYGVFLQAKSTPSVFDPVDEEPHIAAMDITAIIMQLRKRGLSQAELARRFFTTQQSVSRWETGERTPSGPAKALILEMAEEYGLITSRPPPIGSRIKVMGLIGAGGEISPEFEQIPPEGLDQIDLMFRVPKGTIGFEVRGLSMWPHYDEGDVILVLEEPKQSAEQLIGQEVAVRTDEGGRYVKRLKRGARPKTFNLESFNAPLIEDVHIAWVSPVEIVAKARQVKKAKQ